MRTIAIALCLISLAQGRDLELATEQAFRAIDDDGFIYEFQNNSGRFNNLIRPDREVVIQQAIVTSTPDASRGFGFFSVGAGEAALAIGYRFSDGQIIFSLSNWETQDPDQDSTDVLTIDGYEGNIVATATLRAIGVDGVAITLSAAALGNDATPLGETTLAIGNEVLLGYDEYHLSLTVGTAGRGFNARLENVDSDDQELLGTCVVFDTPEITSTARQGTTFSLEWTTRRGESYRVLKTSDLSASKWKVLASSYPKGGANGEPVTYADMGATGETAYYRIERIVEL